MSEVEACSLVPAAWDCPAAFRRRLGEQPGRQRVITADEHLLLILHAPPLQDDLNREGRFFWRDPTGVWTTDAEPGGKAALAALVDDYRVKLEEARQAEIAANSAHEYFGVLTRLNPLTRSVRNLYDALRSARKEAPDDRLLILLRDRAYVLTRTSELLHTDAQNALDFAVARRAEEQAESSHQMAVSAHRLNLLAAFFFPMVTLAGILGMDLDRALGEYNNHSAPLPLLAVVAVGVVCGIVLTRTLVRQQRPRRAQRKSKQ